MEPRDDRPPPLPSIQTTPPPLPRPVMPLRYGTDEPRRWGARWFLLRMTLGFLGYPLVTAGWFWMTIRLRLNPQIIWGVWMLMTAGLLGLALYLRLRYRVAGYGYGILTALLMGMLLAIALVILLIGTCFKAIKSQ